MGDVALRIQGPRRQAASDPPSKTTSKLSGRTSLPARSRGMVKEPDPKKIEMPRGQTLFLLNREVPPLACLTRKPLNFLEFSIGSDRGAKTASCAVQISMTKVLPIVFR